MSTQKDTNTKAQLTYFEKQRDALISEIATSMESVLNNINALNRSLEGAIAVGKEFDSVASLWANFYDGLAQQEQLRPQSQGEPESEQEQLASHDVEDSEQQDGAMDVDKDAQGN